MRYKLAILVAMLVAVAYAATPHEAIVTAVKGTVTQAGKPVPLATRLDKGARLDVPAGASVTVVYLTDSHKETLTGPGFLQVGGASQGKLESQSGPGAISAQTVTTSRGAVASHRAPMRGNPAERKDIGFEMLRTGADGNTEAVFWVNKDEDGQDYDGLLSVTINPYEAERSEPGDVKLVDIVGLKTPQPTEVEREPLPGHPARTGYRVVPLGIKLEEGVPYRLIWEDNVHEQLGYHRWVVLLSPERADALLDMQRWAYGDAPTADKYLSLVQIASEWKDFGVALDAAEAAHKLAADNETARETYKKLLFVDMQDTEATNL